MIVVAFVWLGGLCAVAAFTVAALWVTSLTRYGLVLLVGLVLAVSWFAFALLSAPSDPNHVPNCSDCSYTWGHWWEPQLVVAILLLNMVAWVVGATLGALLRRLAIGRRAAHGSS